MKRRKASDCWMLARCWKAVANCNKLRCLWTCDLHRSQWAVEGKCKVQCTCMSDMLGQYLHHLVYIVMLPCVFTVQCTSHSCTALAQQMLLIHYYNICECSSTNKCNIYYRTCTSLQSHTQRSTVSLHHFIFPLLLNSAIWWRAISHPSVEGGNRVVGASWVVLQQEPLW